MTVVSVSRSIEKSTQKSLKPLKQKHIEIITMASGSSEIAMHDLVAALNVRLHKTHWCAVFKTLILFHIMMREGATDRVLGYLAGNAAIFHLASFRDQSHTVQGPAQSKYIRLYAAYLEEKALSYRTLKRDLAVIHVLPAYFELAKPLAQRCLNIYKLFAAQTTKTVAFFDVARTMRYALAIDIPEFKYAPVSLAGALEDYL
ncbi:hypothetical protein CXG81DRAFT_11673, partial [Caulochytrium protostelioides]